MNNERLNEVIEYLKTNPETHRQEMWTNIAAGYERVKTPEEVTINCGTAGCLAGHGSFRFAPAGTRFYQNHLVLPGEIYNTRYPDYALKVFELTYWEALWIFDENRTIDEMEDFVNDPEFYAAIKAEEYVSNEEFRNNDLWFFSLV